MILNTKLHTIRQYAEKIPLIVIAIFENKEELEEFCNLMEVNFKKI